MPVWSDEQDQCVATMGLSIKQLSLKEDDGLVLEDGYQLNRDMTLFLAIGQEWADAEVGSDVDEP